MKLSSETTDEVWYRYEDYRESDGCDEWGESLGCHTAIRIRKLYVIKKTPKGVRLDNGRVVIEHHNKKYACPTKELALESFLARKQKQISIYTHRVTNAKEAIDLAMKNKRTRYGSSL